MTNYQINNIIITKVNTINSFLKQKDSNWYILEVYFIDCKYCFIAKCFYL